MTADLDRLRQEIDAIPLGPPYLLDRNRLARKQILSALDELAAARRVCDQIEHLRLHGHLPLVSVGWKGLHHALADWRRVRGETK